jgi:hypothetical protein
VVQLTEFRGVEQSDAGDAVGAGTVGDPVEAAPFRLVEGDEDLADLLVRQVLLAADVLQQAYAPAAERRLQRARG